MYRVLVTGGAGFIGNALTTKLVDLGHNVIVVDLKTKIDALVGEIPSVKYMSIDISSEEQVKMLSNEKFDFIFHLAAQTSGRISQESPELDVDTNVKGMLNICNLARLVGNSKIIFTSSMAVYGNKSEKLDEEHQLLPCSNYGVSKLAGEAYLKMFRDFDVKSTIFRLFNVYGPGQDMKNLKQGMASIYMSQLITDTKIDVTGSLDRFRDFIYIDDVVDALILGLQESTNNKVFNVGSEVKTTVAELISLIVDVSEHSSESVSVKNVGGHEGDQFGTVSDTKKLRGLEWKPQIELKEGLKRMYLFAKREMQ